MLEYIICLITSIFWHCYEPAELVTSTTHRKVLDFVNHNNLYRYTTKQTKNSEPHLSYLWQHDKQKEIEAKWQLI